MFRDYCTQIPTEISQLAVEFNQWRKVRPHSRARYPRELMGKAIKAAKEHSPRMVARNIGIDVRALTVIKKKDKSETTAKIKTTVNKPPVVRLAPVIGIESLRQAIVEVEGPAGWRIRISGVDAQSILQSFMEALS